MRPHFFRALKDKGFECLETKLAQFIVIDVDELNKKRNNSFDMFPETVTSLPATKQINLRFNFVFISRCSVTKCHQQLECRCEWLRYSRFL